jgi:hypothetical protein
MLLGSTPFSAPFARLARLRSAGITDLRHGNLSRADWFGHDRFLRGEPKRARVVMPTHVVCYAIAACMASRASPLAERVLGDGLVPLPSALGQGRKSGPRSGPSFPFPKTRQKTFYGTNHMNLLVHQGVADQLSTWFCSDTHP